MLSKARLVGEGGGALPRGLCGSAPGPAAARRSRPEGPEARAKYVKEMLAPCPARTGDSPHPEALPSAPSENPRGSRRIAREVSSTDTRTCRSSRQSHDARDLEYGLDQIEQPAPPAEKGLTGAGWLNVAEPSGHHQPVAAAPPRPEEISTSRMKAHQARPEMMHVGLLRGERLNSCRAW